MSNKNIWIGLVVVLIIAITLPLALRQPTGNLGARSGPETANDFACYAGVCTYYRSAQLKTSTTTICDLVSPNATTTLPSNGISVNFTAPNYASSSAAMLTVATSTSAFATTSLVFAAPLATSTPIVLTSTTTTATIGQVVPPLTHFVMSLTQNATLNNAAVGTYSPSGVCQLRLYGVTP